MLIEENVRNERLRRARHLKGWTQSELAERLGSDFETVSRWERGFTVPNAYYHEKLCGILDKTAEELGLILDLQEPQLPHTSSYVFLASAYADTENEFVTQLKVTLQSRGIPVVSNRTLRRQGAENKTKALQEAIRAAQAVLLIASPEARSSRSVQEALQLARIYKNRVCVVWIDGEHWQECIPKDSGEFFAILDARKNNDYRVFDEIAATLEEVWCAPNETAVSVTTTNESAEPPGEPRNPYKGLKAFRGEDRHDFFGRDSLIEELAAGLEASLNVEAPSTPNARLLSLVGPSGSGKSSIVLAGLLPRLQAGALSGSEEWVYLDPMVPGVHPIESLTLALARQMPDRSLRTIRDDLEDETKRGLHLLANHLRTRPEIYVVLFVDQFEEVFTQMISEEERQHFLDLLVTAVTEPQGAIIVILTLRADFYDRPMHYPDFWELLKVSQRLVLPMDLKGLREAVEKPAGLPDVQLTFEGDLVGDLLFEVQGQVGAMPLLQFTLDQLFQRRRNLQLTLQAYREIGGVKGALARHAESTYASLLTNEHRTLARTLFLRLIDPGLTEQDTIRRRAALAEISLPNAKLSVIIREVVDAFVSARLLTTNEFGGITTVEVSHEALIREWPRLTEWLREGREDIHLQQAISEDSIEWEQRGQPKDRLYRGSQLTDANTWAQRNFPSRSEVAFLQASTRQHMRYVVSILLVIVLLASTTGLSGWLITHIPPSSASPTLVTTLSDNERGSLRQAIDVAAAGSTITFDPNLRGTIRLTSVLNITKNLFIRGTRTGALTISSDSPPFHDTLHVPNVPSTPKGEPNIITGRTDQVAVRVYVGVTVTISNISFKGIDGEDVPIFNEGTLTLTTCIISDNTAFASGAIVNRGTLDLINSTISDNTFIGPYSGGAILNDGGLLTIENSTISGNRTSRFIGADGIQAAGGIYSAGMLFLTNSTVSDNTDSSDHGVGGIQIETGDSHITFSTIYGNTGYIGGIAIGFSNESAEFFPSGTMRNSLVAGNHGDTVQDIWGPLTSDGDNLIQNASGATITRGDPNTIDLKGVSPNVGPLQDNGGPTQTHALFPNSPAIDKISLAACHIIGFPFDQITTDQRGVKRPQGSACDIGAYEYVPFN